MSWGTGEKIGLATLIVTLIGVIAAIIVIPEVRRFFHLESPTDQQERQQAKLTAQPTPTPLTLTPSHAPNLQGRWVDTHENEFYTFLTGGKVEYRLHPFNAPHPWSAQMSWYQLGTVVHFKNIGPYGKECEGTISEDIISGKCFTNRSGSESIWELHRLPAAPIKKKPIPKPRDFDGIWLESRVRINGRPIFVEFLPDGKLPVRLDPTQKMPLFLGDSWYESEAIIHVTYVLSNDVLECYGKADGDAITGKCKDAGSPLESDWRIERAKK